MTDRNWETMDERAFESALERNLPELPPEDMVREITPWRKATRRVLVGLAMSSITLNFWGLQFLLPAIGLILSLLGFRTLRQENRWLRACWILTLWRAGNLLVSLTLNATIYQQTVAASPIGTALTLSSLLPQFLLCICLWRGFRAVQIRAGLPPRAGSALGLLIWYGVISLLAAVQYSGLILAGLVLLAYVLILRSLFRLSKVLDEAGYAVRATAVRLPDWALAAILAAAMLLCVGGGYLCANQYDMAWTPTPVSDAADVAATRAELSALGFPTEILEDLTDADVLACRGARRVVVDVAEHAFNDGRIVEERIDNVLYRDTVYDVHELQITSVAVELPMEREQWKLFHHFRWVVDPGFWGTEAIQLWPAHRVLDGWGPAGDYSGQVLYDHDGVRYTAPYHWLGEQSYVSDSIFFGPQENNDVFATFSLPTVGENRRGYVSYAIQELQDGYLIDGWINYTHQVSRWQYPVQTAMEKRIANGWRDAGAFRTIQDALQFRATEAEVDKIS